LAVFGSLLGNIIERKKAEEERERLNREIIKSNERLRQLALRDSHTGLYNHRYLTEIIEAEFFRAKRYSYPLSVIMLDIDYFKSVNDVYGHHFGDLVLKQLAEQLKKKVRRYDIVVRFGGEEFIVISPNTDMTSAFNLAQRILESINVSKFGNKEHTINLKASLAVGSYPEDQVAKGINLIELVDELLNKVKEFGGNRVYSSIDISNGKAAASKRSEEQINTRTLKEKLDKLTKRANQSLIEAVFAFAKTIEVKDHYTGEHVEMTVHYAIEIAKGLNFSAEQLEYIRQAAVLHDLGKIGISEKILLKKSKLTPQEFEEIKKHPQIGADIIRPIHFLHTIIPFILYHHERWDGQGYPSSLKKEEIPQGARILALADTYQALTSDRPYRKAYPKDKAIEIIKSGSGTQFDPAIVELFLKILQKET
jgi:diguanylate cyclase (GGDEF)-like protein